MLLPDFVCRIRVKKRGYVQLRFRIDAFEVLDAVLEDRLDVGLPVPAGADAAAGQSPDFTNDLGVKPLNIVIKMTRCNNQPVAKVSDSPGKGMCKDTGFLEYLKKVFKIKD